jgi:hypothetical protein
MARIRSVFPGLFTDEAFAPLSDAAQITLIGIWTEADDNGVFEWKPVSLRMRLRPSKDGSIEPMLDELAAANVIMAFEAGGKRFGAVRNFKKYQRPKSPKAIFPLPDDVNDYVTGSGHGSAVTEGMNFPRDATASERQARKREKDRRNSRDGDGSCHGSSVTDGDDSNGSSVTISASSADVTAQPLPIPQNGEVSRQREEGGDKGKGEESKKAPDHPSGDSPPIEKIAAIKPKRAANRPMPDESNLDFRAMHDLFVESATKLRVDDAESEFHRFVDHHRAKGSVFADWHAAGRTWLRNTIKFSSKPGGGGGQRPNGGFTQFLVNRAEQTNGTVTIDNDDLEFSPR